jgi:hypothetical protein
MGSLNTKKAYLDPSVKLIETQKRVSLGDQGHTVPTTFGTKNAQIDLV